MILEMTIAVLITAAVLDIFVGEGFGYFAIAVLSTYILFRFDISLFWFILADVGAIGVASVVYYNLLKPIRGMVKKVEGNALPQNTGAGAVGQVGIARMINHQLMIEWNGDLWPATTEKTDLEDGDRVTVLAFEGGKLSV